MRYTDYAGIDVLRTLYINNIFYGGHYEKYRQTIDAFIYRGGKHKELYRQDFDDFEPEEEKLLCNIIRKQTGSDFVFVTHYNSSKRRFYAMDTKADPNVTESFDLLFRGMEVTTG